MVDHMGTSEPAWRRTFISAFFVLALLCGVLNAAAASSSVSTGTSRTATIPAYPLTNNTNTSGSTVSNISIIRSSAILTITPAIQEALEQGPMVYAATQDSILVMDSSTLNVVSKIKPDVDEAHVTGVAVSPDGQFVYMAYFWSKYQDDPYGGYTDTFGRVLRLNASTDQPIDYYEVDKVYPEHLAVSPDGRVYMGYQKAGYPEHGGIDIMDFQGQKTWNIDMKHTTMMYNIEFSPDGNMVYYSGWWDAPSLYELDWNANTIHYNKLPGNDSTDDNYARSVAVGKGGNMVYAAIADSTGIFAMNTQDHGKQVIETGYYPIALATSPDGETLYAAGYFYDSDNKKVFLIHKYGGLKTVGPFSNNLLDYMLFSKDYFYTYDSTSYITTPSGDRPSRMAVTSDGRFAYISTIWGDGASNVYGDGIILYDLQYMNQVKTFDAKDSLHDIAASSSKIIFSPPADYNWVKQFAGSAFHGTIGSTLLVPTSFYPANGTFAKSYKEDYFVIDADFSDTLDNKTVNSSTFWLSEKSGANVSGRVVAASKLAILSPDSQLKPDTDYVMHASKEIRSKDGKQLYADIQWGFTTRNVTISSILPINTLLNISLANDITPIARLNLSMPLRLFNNSSGANQSVQPPPEAIQNQSQGQQPQNQSGNQTPQQQQGTGVQSNSSSQQPPAQPAPNVTQPSPNVTQPTPNTTTQTANATQPASNTTPLPATPSGPGYAPLPRQPPAPGGTGILDGIISFFKSLLGMK